MCNKLKLKTDQLYHPWDCCCLLRCSNRILRYIVLSHWFFHSVRSKNQENKANSHLLILGQGHLESSLHNRKKLGIFNLTNETVFFIHKGNLLLIQCYMFTRHFNICYLVGMAKDWRIHWDSNARECRHHHMPPFEGLVLPIHLSSNILPNTCHFPLSTRSCHSSILPIYQENE